MTATTRRCRCGRSGCGCVLLSFLNLSYRTKPIIVTQITLQVASLPLGHFLARVLPARKFRDPAWLLGLGLGGPRRSFGALGNYGALNWFFLAGAAGPAVVYALHRAFPARRWIRMVNLPVLIGATASMPPATAVNYNAWAAWLLVGVTFNFFVFRYRKRWWQRYNYILSAALDAGVAFMGVLLYFTLCMENRNVSWWGADGEHCPLASCPPARGVDLGPDSVCPVR